ncbi:MAG: FAD-binding protein [Proteobacteria bacterium]|nr:FAD-binding protein [Pseudomonadota bacterium]
MAQVRLQNWKREISYHANSLEVANSADDIVRIVTDRDRYPGPVRVKGSHHSTTRCVVNEGGTVIDMTRMNRILNIDKDARTITMEAGVLHIDAARELEKHGLQFYVNVEIGNMTVGSGACGGTKDASFHSAAEGWEFGQVASYAIGIKAVTATGEMVEVTEGDGELMAVMRSSYGMLGVIYEVTYRVKEIKPMAVEHIRYDVDEFAGKLEDLVAGDRSMMLYMFPFLNRVMVEYRSEGDLPLRSNAWQWRLRNFVWSKLGPIFGKIVTRFVPFRGVRAILLNATNRLTMLIAAWLLKGKSTSPADQIIRYPEIGGFGAYTFSIWAFPRAEYPATIRAYFRFCQDYYDRTGFRCDLLNVGYHIAEDRQSLFSYTRSGPALTLDPVSTGGPGWEDFLAAYNDFSIRHNGAPLFNQTPGITPSQAQAAFGPEIRTFLDYRKRHDPGDRFYTDYFRNLFEAA